MDNSKRISISGVQEKYSLIQTGHELRLTETGERGTHILKPMPVNLRKPADLPANEHVTMQIAAQVYRVNTAASALIFFKNGEAAYITRRFDMIEEGDKRAKEDFATLAGKSAKNGGLNFKYDSSYETMGSLIRQYVPAWKIEMEKFFALVLFNYLFSNGDAHLKNFALLETPNGDHILSPAYDLVNTRLHIDDTDFAFEKGLFEDGFKSKACQQYGYAAKEDFIQLGKRLQMEDSRINKLLEVYLKEQPMVEKLVGRSYLEEKTKEYYLIYYRNRLKSLNA